MRVADFRKTRKAERVLCMTATATPEMVDNILEDFNIPPSHSFNTPFYRRNLNLWFRVAAHDCDRRDILLELLRTGPGKGTSIVFATTRENCEDLCDHLHINGFPRPEFYHGQVKKIT